MYMYTCRPSIDISLQPYICQPYPTARCSYLVPELPGVISNWNALVVMQEINFLDIRKTVKYVIASANVTCVAPRDRMPSKRHQTDGLELTKFIIIHRAKWFRVDIHGDVSPPACLTSTRPGILSPYHIYVMIIQLLVWVLIFWVVWW